MVNRVILIGNLGRDPEVRRLESGAVVAKFSLATSESYRDKDGNWQDQTEWHDIVVWRTLAERAEQSLKKGMTIYIEGKLTHRTWQDQEGKNRKTTEVVADYFRIIDRKQGSSGTTPAMSSTTEPHAEMPAIEPHSNGAAEDLPF